MTNTIQVNTKPYPKNRLAPQNPDFEQIVYRHGFQDTFDRRAIRYTKRVVGGGVVANV